ncbi:MAG: TonB-dependent receptor, partial [Candidatus Omnitrophica bacterium]|nr:TonB-dependent receptor [Candidatus Omnitrophota bacterium]
IISYGGLGASKTISMRGATASQVLVLVDGRPINSPRDGQVDLNTIPLQNIERIEVMHGPGSSLYGTGAMGGTVNIITKNPPAEKQTTELSTSFGTFKTYIERLSHGARISKFGYLLTGEYESSRGYRQNSAHRAKDINAKFNYKLDDASTFTFNSGFFEGREGTPGPITAPDADDTQRNIKNFFSAGWDFAPEAASGLAFKIYQNYDRLEFMENSAGSLFEVTNQKDVQSTSTRGIDLHGTKQFLDNYHAVLGFNYITNINDSTSSAKHSYDVRAIYAENQLELFDSLTMNLGARFDDYSNFGAQVSPHFNALYRITPDVRLRGSISRSFRAPTFNDLYWPDEGWAKGNPELTPEKGLTGEIGIEATMSRHLTSYLSFYRSDYSELINWVEEAGVWQPKNINSATINGIELGNKINLMDNLELNLGYTYLDAKDDKIHKRLIYQPKHRVNCSLKSPNIAGFAFEIEGRFTGERFHDQENTIALKRFFILGFSISRKFGKNTTYFLQADNLLNNKYQTVRDYPMPGFSITNGIKLEF